jgi:dihydroxyacetone kinase-like protein
VFEENMDYLNELDSKIGDGDHGLSMVTGFRALENYVKASVKQTIRDFFILGGQEFNEAAGSTIGILMFSAMKAAGETVEKGKEYIGLPDLSKALDATVTAIQKRGKACVGQKTILDSLQPASSILLAAIEKNNASEREAIQRTVSAAFNGAQSTIDMRSAIGRGRWFKERTIGVMDPGAFSGYLIINVIAQYIREECMQAD